jgi:tRNA (guanosine-2'-O-)-methyltransferase
MSKGVSARRVQLMKQVIANKQFNLTVLLENVHDAHNIGAVLRSCESVGIQEVYLLYTDKDLYDKRLKLGKRTSSGARKWLDVFLYNEINSCIQDIRARYKRLLGAYVSEKAVPLYGLDLVDNVALVFGNEKDGISEELLACLDGKFQIPQVGFVKSLNISVACAVSLYEAMRQRMLAGLYNNPFNEQDIRHSQLYSAYYDRNQLKRVGRRPEHK